MEDDRIMNNAFAEILLQQAKKAKRHIFLTLLPAMIIVAIVIFILGFILGAIIF